LTGGSTRMGRRGGGGPQMPAPERPDRARLAARRPAPDQPPGRAGDRGGRGCPLPPAAVRPAAATAPRTLPLRARQPPRRTTSTSRQDRETLSVSPPADLREGRPAALSRKHLVLARDGGARRIGILVSSLTEVSGKEGNVIRQYVHVAPWLPAWTLHWLERVICGLQPRVHRLQPCRQRVLHHQVV